MIQPAACRLSQADLPGLLIGQRGATPATPGIRSRRRADAGAPYRCHAVVRLRIEPLPTIAIDAKLIGQHACPFEVKQGGGVFKLAQA